MCESFRMNLSHFRLSYAALLVNLDHEAFCTLWSQFVEIEVQFASTRWWERK